MMLEMFGCFRRCLDTEAFSNCISCRVLGTLFPYMVKMGELLLLLVIRPL